MDPKQENTTQSTTPIGTMGEGLPISRRTFVFGGLGTLLALAMGTGCRKNPLAQATPVSSSSNGEPPKSSEGENNNIVKYEIPIGGQIVSISYNKQELEAIMLTGAPVVLTAAADPIPGDALIAAGALATMVLATTNMTLSIKHSPELSIQEPVVQWPIGQDLMTAMMGISLLQMAQVNYLTDLAQAQHNEFVRDLLVSNFMVINGENGNLYVGEQPAFPSDPDLKDIKVADVLATLKGLNDLPAFNADGRITNISLLAGDVLLVGITPTLHEDLIHPGLSSWEWAGYHSLTDSPLLKRLIESGRLCFVNDSNMGRLEDFSPDQISIIEGRVREIRGNRQLSTDGPTISVMGPLDITRNDGSVVSIPVIKGNPDSIQGMSGIVGRVRYKDSYRTPITDPGQIDAFYGTHDEIARSIIKQMENDPSMSHLVGQIGEIRYPGSLLGHVVGSQSDHDVVFVFPGINDDKTEEEITKWLMGLEDDVMNSVPLGSPAKRVGHVVFKFGHSFDRARGDATRAFPFGHVSTSFRLPH